jgi:hypothetical protein
MKALILTAALLLGPSAEATSTAPAVMHKAQPTLVATPDVLRAGESFTVSGCGYNLALGNVIVGFEAGSQGSPLDASGCFSIAGIFSGMRPPGTYPVIAYQYVHGHLRKMAETSIQVTVQ